MCKDRHSQRGWKRPTLRGDILMSEIGLFPALADYQFTHQHNPDDSFLIGTGGLRGMNQLIAAVIIAVLVVPGSAQGETTGSPPGDAFWVDYWAKPRVILF